MAGSKSRGKITKKQTTIGVWSSTLIDGLSPTNEKRLHSSGRQIICLSVSLVGPTKILNMSNNAGQLLNTSFVGRSWRQDTAS